MRKLIILALGVGVACTALWFQVREVRPRDADAEVASPRPATIDSVPAAAARRHPRAALPPQLAPVAAEGAPVPRDDDELEAVLARQRDQRQVQRERIRAALERQPRDSSWAGQLEGDVRTSIGEVGGADLVDVECRTSLCAVVMTHPDFDRQTESMNALAGAPGFRLAGTAHLEFGAGQQPTTFVFLARDADRFPSL